VELPAQEVHVLHPHAEELALSQPSSRRQDQSGTQGLRDCLGKSVDLGSLQGYYLGLDDLW
jgi:hypothetical protein